MKPANVDAGLFWTLPGPRRFITQIARYAEHQRKLEINLPYSVMPGTWDAVARGLADAHLRMVRTIVVRGGSDIAADIGLLMERQPITGAQLATHVAPTRCAFILRGEDARGREACHRYFDAFAGTSGQGNVTLVTARHDESVATAVGQSMVSFDGGLTTDEMEAYVSLRMIGRPGPGSTRLSRQLVAEFAGFDAVFAERLMEFTDQQILELRDLLPALTDEEQDRWRSGGWLERARSTVCCEPHALADSYQAQHGRVKDKVAAQDRLARRFWRACVKAITPWLEERKASVIAPFAPQLASIAAANSGKISVPTGPNSTRDVDPDDIEYNNIAGMANSRDPNKPPQIVAGSNLQQAAIKVCVLARKVRNEIAHLRPPEAARIMDLVVEMENYEMLQGTSA